MNCLNQNNIKLADGITVYDCVKDNTDKYYLYSPDLKEDNIDIEYFEYLTEFIKSNINLERTKLSIISKLTNCSHTIVKNGIGEINGLIFSNGDYLIEKAGLYTVYYCDYCKDTCSQDKAYYCYDCYKDMCELCYSETNEEIAIKNGATNYMARKKALDNCRKHKLLSTIDRIYTYCDECDGVNPYLKPYYKFENINLCESCFYKSNKNKKNKMIKTGDLNFGSIKNWFCIVTDDEGFIICNLNKNSKYYKSFGLLIYRDGDPSLWNLNYNNVFILIDAINNVNLALSQPKEEVNNCTILNIWLNKIKKLNKLLY